MGLSSFLSVLHTSSASRGAAVAPQLLLPGSSSALGALPNSGPAVSQCRRPALAARPELCPAGGTELCALGRALPSFPHPGRGASPLPTVTSVLPPQRELYIPSPPPIYPHGCSAVFPTNTRLSARSRGELPSRHLLREAEAGRTPQRGRTNGRPSPTPQLLLTNKQHAGRGERLGGKAISSPIGSIVRPSSLPRLSRRDPLFLLVRPHVTPVDPQATPPAPPTPPSASACRVQRKNSR